MTLSAEEKEVYVSIWAKAVDTQMHFNEMSVKARQFGLAFVAAALGLGVVLLARGQEAVLDINYFGGFKLHVSVFIVLASAVSLYAVKLLDLGVYHRMLRGAVVFGEDFEQNYMKEIFDLRKGMTQAISHFSRHHDAGVSLGEGKYDYAGGRELTAEVKITRFYRFSIGSLLFLAGILFLATSGLGFLKPAAIPTSASNEPTAAIPSAPAPGSNAK
jgi:hypothetical protein